MITSGMKAIAYFDISIFTMYKNCGIVLTAILERIIFKKKISKIGMSSLTVVLLASYIVNTKESSFNIVGCVWMVFNIIATTAYVLYLKMMVDKTTSKLDSVFFTEMLGIPILGTFTVAFDERPVEMGFTVTTLIVLSSICALATSFSTAWTLKTISSTTYCMLGASNKLLLSACAIFWFNEEKNVMKIVSLLFGITAGFVYSYDAALQKT